MNHTCCTMRAPTCACGAKDHTDEEHNAVVLMAYLEKTGAPGDILAALRQLCEEGISANASLFTVKRKLEALQARLLELSGR